MKIRISENEITEIANKCLNARLEESLFFNLEAEIFSWYLSITPSRNSNDISLGRICDWDPSADDEDSVELWIKEGLKKITEENMEITFEIYGDWGDEEDDIIFEWIEEGTRYLIQIDWRGFDTSIENTNEGPWYANASGWVLEINGVETDSDPDYPGCCIEWECFDVRADLEAEDQRLTEDSELNIIPESRRVSYFD